MEKGENFRITKLEKGPLQRFKNQNLLLKKYGETALQLYRVITGKRTTDELKSDLEMDEGQFIEIINYMEQAGMIELKPVTGEVQAKKTTEIEEEALEKPKRPKAEKVEEIAPLKEEFETPKEEKIEPEFESEKQADQAFEIAEEEKPKAKKKDLFESIEEEIKPLGIEETKEPAKAKEEKPEEEPEETIEEKPAKEEQADEGVELERLEENTDQTQEEKDEAEGLSPVEKMIKDKYGPVGIKVYELIDGQRTAEEIMKDTGLTESKLVEILDFMDAQGIIKLEYPKGKKEERASKVAEEAEAPKEGIVPILEEEMGEIKEASPLNVPIKTPSNIVKDMQLKAKTILKFGERGGKAFDTINGKNDAVELALLADVPLYQIDEMLGFFLENRALFLKPLTRAEVRKKYGEEGYTAYKRYGKEGLMLYELIGREMTIKQMVEKVTKDKQKAAEMFLFIYQILKIDLPLDKDMLYKQLGI